MIIDHPMDEIETKVLMKCKKCDSLLHNFDQLDLMDPPHDSGDDDYDKVYDDLSNIIIPVAISGDPEYKVIEVPPKVQFENITESGSLSTLSDKMKAANALFQYMNSKSDIDHPMCQDCANSVIKEQEFQLKQAEEELLALEIYSNNLVNKDTDEEEQEAQITELEEEEEKLMKEMAQLGQTDASLDVEIETEQNELQKLEFDYDKLVMSYNNTKQTLWALESDSRSLSQRKRYLSMLSERLKRTNILDILFPIWLQDHFGTINNLRLGKLPEVNVEWAEINAGLGQCVLLLNTVVKKMELTLENYKLIPCGSNSYIESLKDKKRYGLFQVPNFLNSYRSLDQALVMYLDCLRQVMARIEQFETTGNHCNCNSGQLFKFPYQMSSEKFKLTDAEGNSYSIKLSSNTEENWTKALKFVLINLNWMKVWLIQNSFKQYCQSLKISAQ